MRILPVLLLLLGLSVASRADDRAQEAPSGPLQFKMKYIDGEEVDLSERYKGKVCLIVNVPSKPAQTGQYKALNALHTKYADKGLAVLAFPSGDLEEEASESSPEIKETLKGFLSAEIDLFAEIALRGAEQAPLYGYLTNKRTNGEYAGEIDQSFSKFLIGRDGKVIARFKADESPDAPALITAIEAALAVDAEADDWESLLVNGVSGTAQL